MTSGAFVLVTIAYLRKTTSIVLLLMMVTYLIFQDMKFTNSCITEINFNITRAIM